MSERNNLEELEIIMPYIFVLFSSVVKNKEKK